MADDDLTGVWDGLYSYSRTGQLESSFTAILFQTGDALSGTVHETMRRLLGKDVAASALLEGTVEGRRVGFAKTYDGSGGQTHTVVYDGRLSGDEIEGVWTIPTAPGNTGRFLMIRGRKVESGVETGILETVES